MDPRSWNKNGRKTKNKFLGPLIIVFVGLVILLQRLPIDLPEWMFSWNTILIAVGILLALKTRFRHWIWLVPFLIGSGRIAANHFIAQEHHNLIFPIGLILFGGYIFLHLLFYKRDCCPYKKNQEFKNRNQTHVDEDSYIQIENTFGGTERSFISKNLKGGYIKNTFGGVSVNLLQADFKETMEIHIENTFGGITLYIPKNWKVVTKLDSHLSGIDDNSYCENRSGEDIKYLVLKGKSIFGGIEIKNF